MSVTRRALVVVAWASVMASVAASAAAGGGTAGAVEGVRYLDLVFAADDVTVEVGHTYGRALNEDGVVQDLLADVYRPDPDDATGRPAIIWAHGGGFCGGSRTDEPWALDLARRGYVVLSIDYRLRDGCESAGAIRDAQHDMQAAVRWLRANAEDWAVDPARVGVAGYSAGAVMAIEAAQSSDDTGASGAPGQSSWVCFAWSIAGGTLPDVDGRDSPLALFHGTSDTRVPFFLAQAVHTAYQSAGLDSWLFTYPTGHGVIGDFPAEIRAAGLPLARQHLVEGDCEEPPPSPGGGYQRLAPARRAADTRTATGWAGGPLGPGEVRTTDLVASGVVPPAARSVVVNVTAVDPTAATHLTAFPGDTVAPGVSTLNVAAGETRAGSAVLAAPSGRLSVRNNAGSVHVVVDVVGWFGDGAGADHRFVALPPTRVVDTRTGVGIGGPLAGGASAPFPIAGASGVPAGASSTVGNLTAVHPSHPTHLTAWAFGASRPPISNLNAPPLAIVPNLAVVPTGAFGGSQIFNNSGTVDALYDVTGAFVPPGAPTTDTGRFRPVPPTRLMDSRRGVNTAAAPLGPGEVRALDVRGLGGLPPTGIAAVVVNATGTSPSSLTHLTVAPGGAPVPRTSTLNLVAGQTAANATVVPVGPDGTVLVRNESGTTEVVLDVTGWFSA